MSCSRPARLPVELVVCLLLTVAVLVLLMLRHNTLTGDEAVTGIIAQKIVAGSRLFPTSPARTWAGAGNRAGCTAGRSLRSSPWLSRRPAPATSR